MQTTNYAVAKFCNNGIGYIKSNDDFNHLYYWGFSGDTLIKINGEFKKIKEIVDNNLKGENIIGGVILDGSNVQIYNIDGIKVSGTPL